MDSVSAALAGAAVIRLGTVLVMSFPGAPLKSRAQGAALPIGLGIGRVAFRTPHLVETVLASTALFVVAVDGSSASVVVLVAVVAVVAVVPAGRLGVIRARLNRRSDRAPAGQQPPRSHAHWYYVAFEAIMTVPLLIPGILVLGILIPGILLLAV
ncbi:hypothetical protein ACFYQA_17835 [Streptomyces sp. NPDC005774]|uniref:hypothetical protein n=1 Tax=Streptomyces sp. NPDC005774 TaxID=3364728 RepID=UPI0036B1F6E3